MTHFNVVRNLIQHFFIFPIVATIKMGLIIAHLRNTVSTTIFSPFIEMVVFLLDILKVVYIDIFKTKLNSELSVRSCTRLFIHVNTIILW